MGRARRARGTPQIFHHLILKHVGDYSGGRERVSRGLPTRPVEPYIHRWPLPAPGRGDTYSKTVLGDFAHHCNRVGNRPYANQDGTLPQLSFGEQIRENSIRDCPKQLKTTHPSHNLSILISGEIDDLS